MTARANGSPVVSPSVDLFPLCIHKGRKEGAEHERLAIARRLLSSGLTPVQVVSATGLTKAEVTQLSAI